MYGTFINELEELKYKNPNNCNKEDQNFACINKIVFSNSSIKGISKITLRKIKIKNCLMWQVERFEENKVFHENINLSELESYINDKLPRCFKQINMDLVERSVMYKISKKGKVFKNESLHEVKIDVPQEHNNAKNYILKEGMQIMPLVDLGIFNKEFKIIKSKYDKFKQINRFIEIIDDEIANYNKKEITILDFGCGKSYLTFIVYYYLTNLKNIKANIWGYDLKKEVIENCQRVADKYGYSGLEFVVGDISKKSFEMENVDMVITLHACDVATDYALYNAIVNNVKYIYTVPCCQHEINSQITSDNEYSILLKHGLIKERVSSLMTDAIRAEILDNYGYKVDIIEFVDFENSPKNLMLRAKKSKQARNLRANESLSRMLEAFKIQQTLYNLLKNSAM